MPTNTNTGWRGQAAAAGGRFARSGAAGGGRIARSGAAGGGRFARAGTPNRAPNSAGRALAARNRAEVRRRRGSGSSQPSGLGKLLGGLAGGGTAKKAAKAGRRGVGGPASLALLAGAAGLALRNRDKLGSMLGRGGSHEDGHAQATTTIAPAPTEARVVAPASDTTDPVDPDTRPGPAV